MDRVTFLGGKRADWGEGIAQRSRRGIGVVDAKGFGGKGGFQRETRREGHVGAVLTVLASKLSMVV